MTHTKKKSYTHGIVISAIILVVGFYGGMTYQDSKTDNKSISTGDFDRQTMMNMSPEERQKLFNQHDGEGIGRMQRPSSMMRGGAGMSVGKILETSDTTITVDMGEDGSQLILVTDKTIISKPSKVNISELKAGDNIFVSGETNDDGSLIAISIQVRMSPFENNEIEE